MRIAFLHTGSWNAAKRWSETDLLDDIAHFPTTHQSEVQGLLFCYWLQQRGHEITVLSEGPLPKGPVFNHFPVVPLAEVEPTGFDALFLFALHAMRVCARTGLLRQAWRRRLLWMDAVTIENIIEAEDAQRIDAFAWATPTILDSQAPRYPHARHVLCEHATTFPSPPSLGASLPRGIFAGRLPPEYLEQALLAAAVCPMRTYALWAQVGDEQVRLRPGQYTAADLSRVRAAYPMLDLHPGQNMLLVAADASQGAFGLCPAALAPPGIQGNSASKFYDYTALGLPVATADNVPEAQHVRENPILGELYAQGDTESLHRVIHKLLAEAETSEFLARREAIQRWTFEHATYRHRAEVIHDLL